MRLTDLGIKNLPAPERGQCTYTDDAVPGFGVRVSQGGTKTFVLVHGAQRRRETIGRYPTLTLQLARSEARRRLAEFTLGKISQTPIAFEAAVSQFLEMVEKRNKPRTLRDYRRLLRRHFAFGRTRLSDIKPADIRRHLQRLSGTPSEQNHAYVVAQIFFGFAVRQRWIDQNPCDGMTLPNRTAPRERVLSDNEIRAVWERADAFGYPFGTIVKLCLLTGQRRSEIGRLRWDYLDPDSGCITLPASETKNNRQHTFPLGSVALGIIDTLDRSAPYLFPARRDFRHGMPAETYGAWAWDKRAFDQLCPIPHWTLHDLRRTFSTNLAALNAPPHVLERLLNHSSGTISGVAAIYNRFQYIDEMRTAVSAWDTKLTSFLRPSTF